MQTVGVRDLVNRASALLDELEQGGQPIIVTRRGQPSLTNFWGTTFALGGGDVRAELERSVADPARPRDQDGVRWGLPAD